MNYLLYLFGFLPSIVWLLFYLKKDSHPESNRMILKIFFLGMVAAFFAIILEKGFQFSLSFFENKTLNPILIIFLGGALIEEYLKYLVVRIWVFKNSEMDESFDLLLYMIIAALGFAALENILVLTNFHPFLTVGKALETMACRFVSATILHALCSALLGYFLALSFLHLKWRKLLFLAGLGIVTTLHGLYNFSIMKIGGLAKFIIPIVILISLFFTILSVIKRLKRLKSVCKIYNM